MHLGHAARLSPPDQHYPPPHAGTEWDAGTLSCIDCVNGTYRQEGTVDSCQLW